MSLMLFLFSSPSIVRYRYLNLSFFQFGVYLLLSLQGHGQTGITDRQSVYVQPVDVQHYGFSLHLNDSNNRIRGVATINLQFTKETRHFSLDLAGPNNAGKGMRVRGVREKGRVLHFSQGSRVLIIYPDPARPNRSGSTHTYTIAYDGIPADGLIISNNKFGHRGFFGDNWPDRAHNWLPCIDHPSDKATVDFTVTAPDHYQVVSNGLKEKETLLPGHFKTTRWKERVPLPTKVMVIGVADFAVDSVGRVQGKMKDKIQDGVQDIPVYSYLFPEDKQQGFRSYATALDILPFFMNKIGPYSYEKLANVQSRTIFGGMENAGAIFYFEASPGDKAIESLMAHEIAHQWFGDAVTETDWHHIWLSEGFATYMAHMYREEKHGKDSLKRALDKDRKKVFAFEAKRKTPIVDTTVTGNYMQLLNANSYEKGSWVLHMLRRQLGDSLFWAGIREYYATYQNRNANTEDFKRIMESVCRQDLRVFFDQWLYRSGHPSLLAGWNYDPDKKLFSLRVEQKQAGLFVFPLEFTLDGVMHSISIGDKITDIDLPLSGKPLSVIMDPDVNLLAEIELSVYLNGIR
ncbi:M1 family metallopeptidase [Flavitalea flava]